MVGTRVDGIAEQLDGDAGLLVAPEDPRALADAIERLATDFGLRARLGEAARKRVTENFTVAHQVQGLGRAYGGADRYLIVVSPVAISDARPSETANTRIFSSSEPGDAPLSSKPARESSLPNFSAMSGRVRDGFPAATSLSPREHEDLVHGPVALRIDGPSAGPHDAALCDQGLDEAVDLAGRHRD